MRPPPAPPPPVLDELDKRLAREIERLRVRYQLSLDEFRGLYVSDEQVDALLGRGREHTVEIGEPTAALAGVIDGNERWMHVVRTFGLSAVDQDVLLLALAPDLDLKYETVYAYLNDDVTRKWPTADLAARVLGPERARAEVIESIGPASRLRRERLIETVEQPASRPSLLNAGFMVRPLVSRFLQGLQITEPPDVNGADHDDEDPLSDVPYPTERLHEWRRLARMVMQRNGDSPVIVITGPGGSGRLSVARALANEMGLPLRRLDLRAARRDHMLASAIQDRALERRLIPSAVCVYGVRALLDADGRVSPEHTTLLAELPAAHGPVMLLADTDIPWRDLLGRQHALAVALDIPAYSERRTLWRDQLARVHIDVGDAGERVLADRFAFTPGAIARTASAARDRHAVAGAAESPTVADIAQAARIESRTPLGSLAVMVASHHRWSDLVLPAPVIERLKDIASAIQHRHVVYGEWGFARRVATGLGVKVLFAGASGTGKTMAAGVIAREVGLDLVKVDLSGLVSKYIGETEKNLDKVFASVRSGNALLFFDEADALFGKRSEVKDSHDRYANIEVAYLLQKLEAHDGVVVLATNIRRNIDDAFSRRLHYVVDFPQPDAADRERLWRGMFPPESPVDDVDYGLVAREFELCGGDIRNVVLEAAFLAAAEPAAIGMRHLARALAQQQAKQGRTPNAAEFQRNFGSA
ncbi:MAG: ATP-binding protein [Acidobacteria bacterium]|nr:MAG: ATP-binding protein [Acidobacteriota bacterium]